MAAALLVLVIANAAVTGWLVSRCRAMGRAVGGLADAQAATLDAVEASIARADGLRRRCDAGGCGDA